MDILDTAGKEEYMRDNYYRAGDGFLIVYAITMRDTFTDVNRFYDHIKSVREDENVPIVVVGSKCDLEEDREVPKTEGETLTELLRIPFFETSSKTGLNVEEAFFEVVRKIKKYKEDDDSEEGYSTDQLRGGGCCIIN